MTEFNPAEAISLIRSSELDKIFAAIIGAQTAFKAIPKDATNPFFHSKYANLPAVVEAAQPILSEHEVGVVHLPTIIDNADGLLTILIHPSGQFIGAAQRLHPVKSDPQSHGSAITYARRYGFMAALNLVADVDDDGNAASRPAPEPSNAEGRSQLRKLCKDKGIDANSADAAFRLKFGVPAAAGSNDDLKAFVSLVASGGIAVAPV